MKIIDAATYQRMIERFGPWVTRWCEDLPTRLDRLARKWSIQIDRSSSRGSHSCLLLCRLRSGEPAVLKLSPDRSLSLAEASALAAWRKSARVPRLLEFDRETGAILMEAIDPGTPLGAKQGAVPLEASAELVRDLHRAPGDDVINSFPPLIERVEFVFELWGKQLHKPEVASHVSQELLERSLIAARELAARPGPRVLLHGDLHAHNVLDVGHRRGLVAIDPRACVGDPASDLIDWVLTDAGDEHLMRQRAELLASEVGVDPAALWRWCECMAVLMVISWLARGSDSTAAAKSLLSLAESA